MCDAEIRPDAQSRACRNRKIPSITPHHTRLGLKTMHAPSQQPTTKNRSVLLPTHLNLTSCVSTFIACRLRRVETFENAQRFLNPHTTHCTPRTTHYSRSLMCKYLHLPNLNNGMSREKAHFCIYVALRPLSFLPRFLGADDAALYLGKIGTQSSV